jgi:hypothetical protein
VAVTHATGDPGRGRARRAAVLAAIAATALGCTARPLTETADAGGIGAADAGPEPCEPGDQLIGFSLCGTIDGRPVSYAPEDLELYERGVSQVTFEGLGSDGGWIAVWGANVRWSGEDPYEVAGWLFKQPADRTGNPPWFCGQGQTITHHPDDSIDATLTEPARLPACTREGGPDSYQADLTGGILRYLQGGGCEIGFTNSDLRRLTLLTDVCPQIGERLPLDGMRVVTHQRGETRDGTVCIGAGASVMVAPDSTSTSAHLLVDIPSMSLPETCGPATSGELVMKVTANQRG